jgi:hypothetical protein
MANCPKCQSETDDRTCPHCGHDVASTETAPQGKFRFQFGLRFLFFLMTLTAVVCAISKALDNWRPAPLMVVAALLFWRSRRAKYAFFPGFAVGLAYGLFVISRKSLPADKYAMALFLCGTLLAGVNAMFQGEYRRSGLVAMVAAVAYCLIPAGFLGF